MDQMTRRTHSMNAIRFTAVLLSALWCFPVGSALAWDDWTYISLDTNHGKARYGIAVGDVDGDGSVDVVSGKYCYLNPGADPAGKWQRSTMPVDGNPVAVLDLDGDEGHDVVTIADDGVYVLQRAASSWTSTKVLSHGNGMCHACAQGYAVENIDGRGHPEIVVNLNGVTCYRMPSDPLESEWEAVRLSTDACVGIALGDVDGDGDLDVVTGKSGAWWLENPGSVSSGWSRHAVGEASVLDRVAAADMDGDERCDVVVAEEGDGRMLIYRNNDEGVEWEQHEIAKVGFGYLSMHCADFDSDGDRDIVTGESTDEKKIEVWENKGGLSFVPHHINAENNTQTHIGCVPFDMDNDGDLDLVNHSYTESDHVFIWRNDRQSEVALRRESPVGDGHVREEVSKKGRGCVFGGGVLPAYHEPDEIHLFGLTGRRIRFGTDMKGERRSGHARAVMMLIVETSNRNQ